MKTIDDFSLGNQHGKFRPASEALSKLVRDKRSDQRALRNSAIPLLARYNQLQAKLMQAVVRDDEAQISENQLVFATLEMSTRMHEVDGH